MRALARLRDDRRGAAALEFALVCPVLLALLFGLGDLAYQGYLQDVLTGAVQKAGRDSTIQGAATQLSTIDAVVKQQIQAIAPTATFVSTRESYTRFADVAPEPFTDTNHNGIRDAGECFSDVNGNGHWDQDPGTSGEGGAGDVAVYTMKVTYTRLFPSIFAGIMGWGSQVTISAGTVLKNQPYATSVQSAVQVICT